MGKFYASYQLFEVVSEGVGPSKMIWMFDGNTRVFYLDYGAESLRRDVYLNSGPSLAGITSFTPTGPLEPEDHIPEILAMFAPQLFISKAKYTKLSDALSKPDGKYFHPMDLRVDFDHSGKPKSIDGFILEVEKSIDLTIVSSTLSQAKFKSPDDKRWIMYCMKLDQKD